MTRSASKFCTMLAVLPALAACNGTSGDGVTPLVERDAFLIPNTATSIAPTTAEFSSGSITTFGGTRADPEAITFRIDGRTYTFDEAAGDTVIRSGDYVYFRDNSAPVLVQGFIDTRGDHVTYGRLGQNASSPTATDGFYGLVADGPVTANVPTSGGASYSGKAIGYAIVSSSSGDFVRRTNSDVDVTVGFGTQDVDLRTTNSVYSNNSGTFFAPDYDVSGQGRLNGTEYSGDLESSRRSDLTGEFRGELFGGAADETGGTILFQDGATSYGAAFGASRIPGQID